MTNPGDGAAGAVDCATLDHWRPRLAAIAAAAGQDDAAHDLGHLRRVWDAARAMLQAHPEADALVVLAASYLHDLVNLPKNHPERHLASRQAAAAVLLVAVGWAGHVGYAARYPDMRHVVAATAPSFVEDAVQAHRTAKVRAAMASQPRVPHLDADELLRATGVRVPALPASWAVRDVQVFPGRTGPSVEMEVEAAGLGRLWVFAAREPAHAAEAAPVVSRFQDAPIAYWQQGQWAYAITGDLPDAELGRAAGQMTVAMLATP
ncbi:hypothetical protein [Bordetella bronchiseptica]